MSVRFHSLYPTFVFNVTATTAIYTLSLHDALPILPVKVASCSSQPGWELQLAEEVKFARAPDGCGAGAVVAGHEALGPADQDRKSTRLNSSHVKISYAVFCLKKKKKTTHPSHTSV